MIDATIDAKDYFEFTDQVKAASPDTTTVFRDGTGYVCTDSKTEFHIVPDADSLSAYNNFFYGQTAGFEGVVSVPETADYTPPPPEPEVPPVLRGAAVPGKAAPKATPTGKGGKQPLFPGGVVPAGR